MEVTCYESVNNVTEFSDGEVGSSMDPSLSNDGSEQVISLLLPLTDIELDHVYITLDQTVDSACHLHDIHDKQLEKLSEPMHAQGYNYRLGMMNNFCYSKP